jgi:trk system potassium uptake protein TrkA
MKRFAIIGLSSFGRELAVHLAKLGNEVTVVDRDKEKIQAISKQISSVVTGDAGNIDLLKKLEIDQMDGVLVSTGAQPSTSILITLVLKELNVKNLMVRAVDEDHARILSRVGADVVIQPELDMAQHLAVKLHAHSFLEYVRLSQDYNIVEIAPPFEFLNKSIAALDLRKRYNVHIIGIRDVITDKFLIAPAADHIIKDSEILIVIGSAVDLKKLRQE